VTKRVKAMAQKETNIDDDSDSELDDDDSDDDSDDDDEEDSKENRINAEDEETKDGEAMNEEQLGFVENKVKRARKDSDDSDDAAGGFNSDAEDSDDDDKFSCFDLKMSMEMLQCPVKKEDETKVFKETLQSLSARSPAEMNAIIQEMSEANKDSVRRLLASASIECANQTVPRRIVRVVRKQ